MTRPRFMNLIRKQDYYRPMLEAIRECGASYEITAGRGHPILTLYWGERATRIPLPSSPSTRSKHGPVQYVPAEIRRRAREAPPHATIGASE